MPTWPGKNPYPSIDEFNGFYNIPDQYDNIGLVLRSDENLPEFGFPELWKVYQAALRWFAKAFPLPQPRPTYVESHEEIFVPVCEADDRHLVIEHVDYGRLTVPLLLRMQKEFLSRFPLWRLQLQGWNADSDILVYPKAIRFGNQPVETNPDEGLRKLVAYARPLREAELRPKQAQIAFLRERLPDAVREIGDRKFLVMGILDRFAYNPDRLTICLLVRGDDSSAVTIDHPPGSDDEFLSTGGTYYANSQGTLIPSSLDEAPFSIELWLVPKDFRGPLTLIDKATGERHIYEVKSEEIVRLSMTD